jgi:hypothetical protein
MSTNSGPSLIPPKCLILGLHGRIVYMFRLARRDSLILSLLVEEPEEDDLDADESDEETEDDKDGSDTGDIVRLVLGLEEQRAGDQLCLSTKEFATYPMILPAAEAALKNATGLSA